MRSERATKKLRRAGSDAAISLLLIRDTDGLASAAPPQQQQQRLHAFNHLLLLRREAQLRLPSVFLEPLHTASLNL